ncbi:CLUMA_CG021577, isoform A [Clunio marinus]|uniref:CLUMA_CG021577, isoform A n=1 Tax=Clunio marinus TaxID=568069 RepID=A0A1J1J862_9DIPT|nr:CLUMA_CG021577, isoform A [Clunio marinus]
MGTKIPVTRQWNRCNKKEWREEVKWSIPHIYRLLNSHKHEQQRFFNIHSAFDGLIKLIYFKNKAVNTIASFYLMDKYKNIYLINCHSKERLHFDTIAKLSTSEIFLAVTRLLEYSHFCRDSHASSCALAKNKTISVGKMTLSIKVRCSPQILKPEFPEIVLKNLLQKKKVLFLTIKTAYFPIKIPIP